MRSDPHDCRGVLGIETVRSEFVHAHQPSQGCRSRLGFAFHGVATFHLSSVDDVRAVAWTELQSRQTRCVVVEFCRRHSLLCGAHLGCTLPVKVDPLPPRQIQTSGKRTPDNAYKISTPSDSTVRAFRGRRRWRFAGAAKQAFHLLEVLRPWFSSCLDVGTGSVRHHVSACRRPAHRSLENAYPERRTGMVGSRWWIALDPQRRLDRIICAHHLRPLAFRDTRSMDQDENDCLAGLGGNYRVWSHQRQEFQDVGKRRWKSRARDSRDPFSLCLCSGTYGDAVLGRLRSRKV